MKLAIYLASCMLVFFITPNHAEAQPNITDSIHVLQKICKEEKYFVKDLVITRKGSIYGTTHKVDGNNIKHFTLIKLNSNYDSIQTGVLYGGNQGAYNDLINKLEELPNGNLVLAGYCESKDGTLQGVAHSNYGREAWVMVVDTLGNILHQKCFGGSFGCINDVLHIDPNGNIYIGGTTLSTDYDFYHNFGAGHDAYLIKLDSSLNHEWTKIWGGDGEDGLVHIANSFNKHHLLLSLFTSSTDSLKGNNGVKGLDDGLIMEIDTSGNEIWSKRYGGSHPDIFRKIMPDSLHQCYYLAGNTGSIDGDIQYKTDSTFYLGEYKGNDWIARIDSVGNLLCSKAYGCKIVDTNQFWGQHQPVYVDAVLNNGAVWYTSHIEGGNGDFPPNTEFSREDFWIAKIDSQCNLRGKYMVNTEYKYDGSGGFFKKDNGLWIYGYSGNSYWADTSHSNPFSCDTTKSIRFYMQLGDAPLGIESQEKPHSINWQVYPNPAQEKCMIQLENGINQSFTLIVSNSQGQVVWSKKVKNKSNYPLNTQGFTKGLYYITLKTSTTQSTQQLMIQ